MKYRLTSEQRLFLNSNLPSSQNQEVLYYLLLRPSVSVRKLFSETGMLNPTARISELRGMGVDISHASIKTTNKFGRDIKYGVYRLTDKDHAFEVYLKLKNTKI